MTRRKSTAESRLKDSRAAFFDFRSSTPLYSSEFSGEALISLTLIMLLNMRSSIIINLCWGLVLLAPGSADRCGAVSVCRRDKRGFLGERWREASARPARSVME